jgi:hypothetical protein
MRRFYNQVHKLFFRRWYLLLNTSTDYLRFFFGRKLGFSTGTNYKKKF